MDGENADASKALAETELSLIQCSFESCRKIVLRPGLELWQGVDEERGPGGSWTGDYKKAARELASLLLQDHIKALIDAYQFFINPKVMRIGASQLRAVSRMPSKYIPLVQSCSDHRERCHQKFGARQADQHLPWQCRA